MNSLMACILAAWLAGRPVNHMFQVKMSMLGVGGSTSLKKLASSSESIVSACAAARVRCHGECYTLRYASRGVQTCSSVEMSVKPAHPRD